MRTKAYFLSAALLLLTATAANANAKANANANANAYANANANADAYEMPRHLLDLNVSKTFGRFTLKAGVKDVLAQKVIFKQFNDVITQSGERKKVEEVTRSYRPGRNIALTLTYRL